MSRSNAAIAIAAAAVVLVACTTGTDVAIDPAWGKDPCAHCGMIVGDRAAAAEAIDPRGERLFFDDVGCMVTYEAERHLTFTRAWVRAPDRAAWIDAKGARYVGGHATPMDYGFVPTAAPSGLAFGELRECVLARKVSEQEPPR